MQAVEGEEEKASRPSIASNIATSSKSSTTTAPLEKQKGAKKPIQPPKSVKSSVASTSAQANPSTNAPGKKKRRKKEVNFESKNSDAGAEDPLGKIRLKTVIRRLPPNVPEAIFWNAVSPWVVRPSSMLGDTTDAATDDSKANIDYGYFVPGKLKDGSRRRISAESGITSHVFSRAYLHFTTIEALVAFHRGFDGHLFRDAKGTEYIAIVEFAPFQRTPLDLAKKRKADPKQGTIEEDPDFDAFLTSLEKKKAEDNGQTQAEKTDAQLMALLTATKSATTSKANAKHTPLLDHLRAQHTARAESSALKNARRYLDRNNNAYAASSSKAAEKGKGKAKGQIKDDAIPTGPKAGNKKSEAKRGAKKGAQAGAKAESSGSGSKTTAAVAAPPILNPTAAKVATKGSKGPKGHGKGVEPNQANSSVSILSKQGNGESVQAAAVASAGPSADRGAPRGRSRPPRGAGGGGRGARGGRPPRGGAPASGPDPA